MPISNRKTSKTFDSHPDTGLQYSMMYKCTCTEDQARIHRYTCSFLDTGYWHMGNMTGPNTVQYMIDINYCIRLNC